VDRRRLKLGLAVAVVGACAAVGGVRLSLSRATTAAAQARAQHAGLQLHVPRAAAPISIDAEIEGKQVWEPEAGGTRNFTEENGKGLVPYTEAKVRWGEGKLYFLLYAGDLDLEGTVTQADGPVLGDDAFHLELGPVGSDSQAVRVIDVSVLGTISDSLCPEGPEGKGACDPGWQSHAVAAVDRDGTLNRTGDNDEEWVVEMAVPLEALGVRGARAGVRIPFAVRRCEVGRDGQHACGGWGWGSQRGELILDP
jgi:hypothetical protein